MVTLLVVLVRVLYSFSSLLVADDNDGSFRYALNPTVWNHWHHCYMCTLAVDKCIRTPCLSFSWNTSDDETYHALFAVPWLRLLAASFLYLSGLSVYWSIHCTWNFDAFWISIVSVWLAPRAMLSNVPLGLGVAPNPSTVLFVPSHSFGIGLAEDRII